MKVTCSKCGNIFDFSKSKHKARDRIYRETQYYCDDCVDKYIDNIFENMVNRVVDAMQEDDIESERIC